MEHKTRKGPGRPRKLQAETVPNEYGDPLEFLQKVYTGLLVPTDAQLKAAIAACSYLKTKPESIGKKEAQAARANELAGVSKFGQRPPPLRIIK